MAGIYVSRGAPCYGWKSYLSVPWDGIQRFVNISSEVWALGLIRLDHAFSL